MALGITVTLEAARDAALVTVTGIPAGAATVTVERVGPSGVPAGVRGAVDAPVTAGLSYIVRDYEAPLGVELAYVASVLNAAGAELAYATTTFELAAGAYDDAWLVDLTFPLNSERVVVDSYRELVYESPVGVHRVLNRRAPVLTSDVAYTPTGDLIFATATELERERARAILGTGVPVLLRTPPEQGVGNVYLGVRGWTEERPSRIAFHADRRFRCQVVEVDRPDPSVYVPLPPTSYADVTSTYASYAALAAAVASYDELAHDYGGTGVAPYPPWPPSDV